MTNFEHNPESIYPGEREYYLRQYTEVIERLEQDGFDFIDHNLEKPWGAYSCIDPQHEEKFLAKYFPGLTAEQARLGNPNAPLSLKILGVFPGHRLSFQFHDRRAERWYFETPGVYRTSETNEEGIRIEVEAGEVVQFAPRARHRLEGRPDGLTVVAEIWQHTDINYPSDEDDIVRLSDDYSR